MAILRSADGTPILTMSHKQQVILDLVENTFTTVQRQYRDVGRRLQWIELSS